MRGGPLCAVAGVHKIVRIDSGIVICVPKSVECREDD